MMPAYKSVLLESVFSPRPNRRYAHVSTPFFTRRLYLAHCPPCVNAKGNAVLLGASASDVNPKKHASSRKIHRMHTCTRGEARKLGGR